MKSVVVYGSRSGNTRRVAEAIAGALELADDRSLVLVAGKGHESTQTIGDRRLPFVDQQVIRDEAGRVPCR